MKFLHLYKTSDAFEADYNGEYYHEPWVSFTEQDGDVNYNKSCEIVSNVVTSLTATDDGLYDVDSMEYRLAEVFQAPRNAIDFQNDEVQLYAKYEPVSGTSAMGTQWLTGYLTVDPTGHTEGQDKFLILMSEGRYSSYEPTLAPPNYGVSGFSFGNGYACPDQYDDKNWKVVATFSGTVPDTTDPNQGNYGAEMTISENTMPEYPFIPEEVALSGGAYFDTQLSFTVNGITYINNTQYFYPFYRGEHGQKLFFEAAYDESSGEGGEGNFVGFRYVLSERKLYVYKW